MWEVSPDSYRGNPRPSACKADALNHPDSYRDNFLIYSVGHNYGDIQGYKIKKASKEAINVGGEPR